MSDGNSGKTEAKEIGLIIGRLEGIQRSQTEMSNSMADFNRSLNILCDSFAEMQTSVAVMRSEQATRDRDIAALKARVEIQNKSINGLRGSWKTALVKYGGSALGGGGIVAALLKLLGIKIGGGE